MRNTLLGLSLIIGFAASPAWANSAFDGTWQGDMKTISLTAKPYELRLMGGIYHCGLCKPEFEVKADGAFHAVKGHDYFDEESVKVINAQSIMITDRKAGKVTSIGTFTVSPDDQFLHYEFTDLTSANGKKVTGSGKDSRVKKGPAGSHAISGLWQANPVDKMSPDALRFTVKVMGNHLHYAAATGENYDVVFGGPPVNIKGDLAKTQVTATKTADNSITLTLQRQGKVVAVNSLTMAADGKSLTSIYEDKIDDIVFKHTAHKQ